MAVTINGDGVVDVGGNASSAAKVRLYEDSDNGTNYIDLIAPASVASNRTVTLPDETGTVLTTGSTFSGTGPAFSAYPSGTQNFTNAVTTIQALNAEHFDTNSNYNTSSYRFTPTVAGYYQVNFGCGFESYTNTGSGEVIAILYRNGSIWVYGSNQATGSMPHYTLSSGSALVYMNGTTDYLECYGYQETGGTRTSVGNGNWNYFSASMTRSA
jgi:hypothetical protein